MREILDQLIGWADRAVPFALAIVVRTTSSAPREVGATMAVNVHGDVLGSVSAGCVESAVVEMCLEAIDTDEPGSAVFGVDSDDAFAVGLTCGGSIEIFVVPPVRVRANTLRRVHGALALDHRVALTTVIAGDSCLLGSQWVDADASSDRNTHLETELRRASDNVGHHGVVQLHDRRLSQVFVHVFTPAPHMIICGAIDLADSLGRAAQQLGYRVTVCDARAVFATSERFPHVDEVVLDWPHRYVSTLTDVENTALCVLTHDEKFEIPLLEWALRQPFAYIGAMGSRAACANRESRLRALGIRAEEMARLHSPIGLDIGGATPAETALSIAAEVIAARANRHGGHLRDGTALVHPRMPGVPSQGLPSSGLPA